MRLSFTLNLFVQLGRRSLCRDLTPRIAKWRPRDTHTSRVRFPIRDIRVIGGAPSLPFVPIDGSWSEEDQCYIGRCPRLMLGGVHGGDERAVYAELCEAVDEWIRLCESEGRPLPTPTSLREIEALV